MWRGREQERQHYNWRDVSEDFPSTVGLGDINAYDPCLPKSIYVDLMLTEWV